MHLVDDVDAVLGVRRREIRLLDQCADAVDAVVARGVDLHDGEDRRKFESVYDSDAYPEDVRYEYVALEELTTRFRISFNYQLEKMPDNAQRDVILDIIHKHKDYLTSLYRNLHKSR